MNWRQKCLLGVLPFCLALATPLWAFAALKADEQVMILPALAHDLPNEAERVSVTLSVWVYETERRPGATRLLARYIGTPVGELNPLERERLYQRSQLFRVDSERGKVVTLALPDGSRHTLPPTDASGRSSLTVTLAKASVVGPGKAQPLPITLVDASAQPASGPLWYVPTTGLSIISDIDDTVKVSDVGDTKKLLQHTFLKPLTPAPGMAAWYQQLMRSQGAAVHYVSSSPLQLMPLLSDFIADAGLPQGSLHLRQSTSWRTAIPPEGASRTHKTTQIRTLLEAYPQRRFILVGDSGELDPEIYTELARIFPHQIERIYIRDVTNEPRTAARYQALFQGLSAEQWVIFAPTGAPTADH
ncbi:App1 family protein [Neisseriaceae bacterium CLB008]